MRRVGCEREGKCRNDGERPPPSQEAAWGSQPLTAQDGPARPRSHLQLQQAVPPRKPSSFPNTIDLCVQFSRVKFTYDTDKVTDEAAQ